MSGFISRPSASEIGPRAEQESVLLRLILRFPSDDTGQADHGRTAAHSSESWPGVQAALGGGRGEQPGTGPPGGHPLWASCARGGEPEPGRHHRAGRHGRNRRGGRHRALAVGGLGLPFALGEVVLLAARADRGGEQGPAVGGVLQGGLQGAQGGVLEPGGIGARRWQGGGWEHWSPAGLLAFASAKPTGRPELCSRMNRWLADP